MRKSLGLTEEEKRIRKNESQKRYRDKNKDIIAIKKKEWKEKNYEWVKKKQREYGVSHRHRASVMKNDRRWMA